MSTRRPPRRTNGAGRGPSGPAGRGPRTMTPGGGGSCLLALIVGTLVVGTSLILTPLATRVWTAEIVPAANRVHFGDGLVVALLLAGFGLYIAVSLLTTRRPISPVGSAAGCTVSSRPGTDAAGVLPASPGASTPAAT